MKQAIAILTHHTNAPFLRDLLSSLEGASYPIVILNNDCLNSPREFIAYLKSMRSDNVALRFSEVDGWDTQLLDCMFKSTDYDEWLFLHDTTLILDIRLLDMVFKDHAEECVSLLPQFFCFIGKYTRESLMAMTPPITRSKKEAIDAEQFWCPEFAIHSNAKLISTAWWTRIEEKHGHRVMAVKDNYFVKYKKSWMKHNEDAISQYGKNTCDRPLQF